LYVHVPQKPQELYRISRSQVKGQDHRTGFSYSLALQGDAGNSCCWAGLARHCWPVAIKLLANNDVIAICITSYHVYHGQI